MSRLISVVDVDITSMNPYQPLTFRILSFANIVQSKTLILLAQREEIVFERNCRFSQKTFVNINTIKNINMNKYHIASDFISLPLPSVLCICHEYLFHCLGS